MKISIFCSLLILLVILGVTSQSDTEISREGYILRSEIKYFSDLLVENGYPKKDMPENIVIASKYSPLFSFSDDDVLAYTKLHSDSIVVSTEHMNSDPALIRHTVAHELVHLWFKIDEHDSNCYLMQLHIPALLDINLNRIDRNFLKYAKQYYDN